jgi:heme exporter protein D
MSYLSYVVAAYLVFALVLLWDYAAPRLRTAQLLARIRRQAARREVAGAPAGSELQR